MLCVNLSLYLFFSFDVNIDDKVTTDVSLNRSKQNHEMFYKKKEHSYRSRRKLQILKFTIL